MLATLLTAALAAAAPAAETYWRAGTGDWFEPANWTNGVPGGSRGYIDNGGTAVISSGDAWSNDTLTVGNNNAGSVLQTGGTLDAPLQIAVGAGSTGTYVLSGGRLDCYHILMDLAGDAYFEQTGGEVVLNGHYGDETWLDVGGEGGGLVRLSGGTFDAGNGVGLADPPYGSARLEISGTAYLTGERLVVGGRGSATVVQTAGTVGIHLSGGKGELFLARYGGNAGYELRGGVLDADNVKIAESGGYGTFSQSGGAFASKDIAVGPNGRYVFTGGELGFSRKFISEGTFDFAGSGAVLTVTSGAIFDLGGGSLVSASNASIAAAANSLVIFPAGFDPASELAGYTSAGVTHVAGSPMVVPAGRGFVGRHTVEDRIDVHGSISWSGDYGEYLVAKGGLRVFDGAVVEVGPKGVVFVDDADSGMTGGELRSGSGVGGTLYAGYQGVGRFEQTGGRCWPEKVILGDEATAYGEYVLRGGQFAAAEVTVGYKGSGRFVQEGGTYTDGHELKLGLYASSQGVYELQGGSVAVYVIYVGNSGQGTFLQTGGDVDAGSESSGGILISYYGGLGRYEISGGTVDATHMFVAGQREAVFEQSGGTVNVTRELYLSYGEPYGDIRDLGDYTLASGTLTTVDTHVGYRTAHGRFTQSGGSHTTGRLMIYENGQYVLSGGELTVTDQLVTSGAFSFGGGAGRLTLGVGAFADFRPTGPVNTGSATMTAGVNSLSVFPGSFDPYTDFGGYHSDGVTYVVGNTLVIPAGVAVQYYGTIADRVECSGTLVAAANADLNLNGGLQLNGGHVDLGDEGALVVEDPASGMVGGSLTAYKEHIGLIGTGTFVQSGGHNQTRYFHVGDQAGSDGTYVLRDSGELHVATAAEIGRFGRGRFVQEGGTAHYNGFLLGCYDGGDGVYELHGGSVLWGEGFNVGYGGRGYFHQTGGSAVSNTTFSLGGGKSGFGTYEMSGGDFEQGGWLFVGRRGRGRFVHTGGTVRLIDRASWILGMLRVGYMGGEGLYELGGTGVLTATEAYISESGLGEFRQSGGTADLGMLSVGGTPSYTGTYRLSGGTLRTNDLTIGDSGHGVFFQTGGVATIAGPMALAAGYSGARGDYVLDGGQLRTTSVYVGQDGHGSFLQTGGEHAIVGGLYVAQAAASVGTYALSDGTLSADFAIVGAGGSGTFTQTGGAANLKYSLLMGQGAAAKGTYILSGGGLSAAYLYVGGAGTGRLDLAGGTLTTRDLLVGVGGVGALDVTGPAGVTVSGVLHFGPGASFSAAAGTRIHMTGSGFVNEASDPAVMAGLGNLSLIFEGGSADVDLVEVAGLDLGPAQIDLGGNFTLQALVVGGADVGRVMLVDNLYSLAHDEVMYVEHLTVGPGSRLDLNGQRLYYRHWSIDPAAEIVGGSPIRLGALQDMTSGDVFGAFETTGGSFGLGEIDAEDICDVVIDAEHFDQTLSDLTVSLTASLYRDDSTGGVASGVFRDGTFAMAGVAGEVLLSGTVAELRLTEVSPAELWGEAAFTVTGGRLAGSFPQMEDNFFEVIVYCAGDPGDFSGWFRCAAQLTLEPIPEPAALGLLALGGAAVLCRRRRRSGPTSWAGNAESRV